MSTFDVEQIVNQNAERAKWAAEVSAASRPEPCAERRTPRKRSQKRFQAIRTAALACAMFAGAGAAFVGIGLAAGDAVTVGVGLLVCAVFVSSGARLEGLSRSA